MKDALLDFSIKLKFGCNKKINNNYEFQINYQKHF